jgi:hypothetical protein
MNWEAKGGKSNSQFRKTLDNRFVIKEMSKQEVQSFLDFAPKYVQYITSAIQDNVVFSLIQQQKSRKKIIFFSFFFNKKKETDCSDENRWCISNLPDEKRKLIKSHQNRCIGHGKPVLLPQAHASV